MMLTPSKGRLGTSPVCSVSMTGRAWSMDIANPMPSAFPAIAVFTPITSPLALTKGPPELPGLIAASVWMSRVSRLPDNCSSRSKAETIPVVTDGVSPRPNALPMARTSSPTSTSEDLPSLADGRSSPSILRTARSLVGSCCTNSAVFTVPSESMTVIFAASSTTWAFVTTCPSALIMNPVPCPPPKMSSSDETSI